MRKPGSSRPCICKGPNHKAREVGGQACAEGLKKGLNESKGQGKLEIFKRPSASPGVEKDRKGSRMDNSMKNVEGLLLWLSWLVLKRSDEFNINRVI